jgi:hypothetical protein
VQPTSTNWTAIARLKYNQHQQTEQPSLALNKNIEKIMAYKPMEIQVLSWNWHKKVVGLHRSMRSFNEIEHSI